MQTNVAVGYAVCYIFGSLGPIIMVSWFLPLVMRWNIRQGSSEAREQAVRSGAQSSSPGQFQRGQDISTRIYQVTRDQQGDRHDHTGDSTGNSPMLRRSYLPRRQIDPT